MTQIAYTLGAMWRPVADDPGDSEPDDGAAHCAGCRSHPSPYCCACGAPTAVTRAAGRHAFTFCLSCLRVVKAVRAQARAERARIDGQREGAPSGAPGAPGAPGVRKRSHHAKAPTGKRGAA